MPHMNVAEKGTAHLALDLLPDAEKRGRTRSLEELITLVPRAEYEIDLISEEDGQTMV